MSTEPQSPFPTLGVSYAEVETSQTIRAATLARMTQALDVLASGRPARRAHVSDAYPNGTSARTYVVSYTRTSDAIAFLYVAAHVSYGYHGDQLTLDLTIKDATGNTVSSSSSAIPAGFKSSNPWTAPPTFSADPQPADSYITTIASGYLDLDALTGTLSDPSWSIELAVASPVGTSLVVNLFEVFEMPRAVVDSADTYGLLSGAVMPGRPLTSGSTSEDGIARLRQTLTGARLAQRTYAQECFGPDDTTAALVPRTTSATYAPLSELDEGGGVAVSWVFRVRTIVGGTGGETARARFRYLVSGGGTAYIRTTTGISTYDSAGLTSATWAWSDWIAVQLKANATGHLETVSFKAKTSAGTLYVSGWILEENVS